MHQFKLFSGFLYKVVCEKRFFHAPKKNEFWRCVFFAGIDPMTKGILFIIHWHFLRGIQGQDKEWILIMMKLWIVFQTLALSYMTGTIAR